jgi:hypothetical protein
MVDSGALDGTRRVDERKGKAGGGKRIDNIPCRRWRGGSPFSSSRGLVALPRTPTFLFVPPVLGRHLRTLQAFQGAAHALQRHRTRSCPRAWCNCGGVITAIPGRAGLVSLP